MVKILDRYILTTFLSTLFTVFIILYFIFILQGIWLFIAELAGKDLDVMIIVQFLLFYSPKMVPLVLPLSVLLASIMSFGNLAENYEFAAMKASGISLRRSMRPLSIFILVLAFISFWFANDVIPKAEYKFINIRKEVIQTKPAMAITAGQFNDLGTINIKVDDKSGPNGEFLENVTMHLKSQSGYENKSVIRSHDGELETVETSNLLQLHLYDGNYYEEVTAKNYAQQQKVPFIKTKFEKYTINIDLSSFQNNNLEDDEIKNTAGMQNIRQLNYTIDSLQTARTNDQLSNTANLSLRTNSFFSRVRTGNDTVFLDLAPENILADFKPITQQRILQAALDNNATIIFNAEANDIGLFNQQKSINSHLLYWHEKFVIAFTCFLMFYIGAPLGAIIRKGGLGLPIVFAVLIFITYHFINTFGKKLAQEDGIHPFLGAWAASLVLTPLAIFLTYKATNDNGMVNFDFISEPVKKLIKRFKKNK